MGRSRWSAGAVATVSTIQARETTPEVLFSASFARTSNVCAPWPRLVNCLGDVQEPNASASTRHSNVAVPSVSENVKLGVVMREPYRLRALSE